MRAGLRYVGFTSRPIKKNLALLQGDGFQIDVQHFFTDEAEYVWEMSREGPQGLPQHLPYYSQQCYSGPKLIKIEACHQGWLHGCVTYKAA